jgi:hypothetical protein
MRQHREVDAIVVELPGPGRWLVQNSPARRVPSHGTELFGTRYAIDLVGVDDRGRSAAPSLRALVASEPPERFAGFGRMLLAPIAGEVLVVHDGEPDHEARRSPFTLLPYALGQAARVRAGVVAIAGNHLIIGRPDGTCVALVHLQAADRVDMASARGLPFVFRRFRERARDGTWVERHLAVPGEGSLVEPA